MISWGDFWVMFFAALIAKPLYELLKRCVIKVWDFYQHPWSYDCPEEGCYFRFRSNREDIVARVMRDHKEHHNG